MGKRGLRQRLADAAAPADASGIGSDAAAAPADASGAGSRGGVRQRVAAAATVLPGKVPDQGPLYRSLRRDWGSGILSSTQVSEYARGAKDVRAKLSK
eukprot:3692586-Pyramimonas_sp.AAC.1